VRRQDSKKKYGRRTPRKCGRRFKLRKTAPTREWVLGLSSMTSDRFSD
jgi:hypothetical protein